MKYHLWIWKGSQLCTRDFHLTWLFHYKKISFIISTNLKYNTGNLSKLKQILNWSSLSRAKDHLYFLKWRYLWDIKKREMNNKTIPARNKNRIVIKRKKKVSENPSIISIARKLSATTTRTTTATYWSISKRVESNVCALSANHDFRTRAPGWYRNRRYYGNYTGIYRVRVAYILYPSTSAAAAFCVLALTFSNCRLKESREREREKYIVFTLHIIGNIFIDTICVQ